MNDIAMSMAQEQIKELTAERDDWYMRALKAEHDNDRLRTALRAVAAYKPGGDHQAVLEAVRRALEPKP